ncbi:probable serine racemase isoform X2 [Mya arenaria]|uniref:probable serine racemase isoform X2 n=1 Tax=Mya arenaria TaxID=6604 RepID=UPI0022E598B5|nr:probable serine racemase isoform X2 [Mya arenaria]
MASTLNGFPVTLDDVTSARDRILRHLHYTPVLTSSTFDSKYGRKFYFKAENFQKTGSFKSRGALNAVTKLVEEKQERVVGVTTHSSGNHGQALAWAAQHCGLPCNVIVPRNTPTVKIDAIKGYGADVTLCEPNPTSRAETCAAICSEKNYVYIPSADHYDVMAGQGTIALEFLEQVPMLDAILVAASAGGMVSGIACAAKQLKPEIKKPFGKDLERCLREGKRLWPEPPQYVDTIAEGIRIQQLGKLAFPIVLSLAEKEVFTTTNAQIVEGMRFAFERMKVVIEGASGAVIAAAMSKRLRRMDGRLRHVGVILCGGNVDIDHIPWLPTREA